MKYHYVYKITNKNSGMMYIGSRSSVVEPSKDIGIEYFSSSVDKEFKSDQRNNPSDYAYEVIETFNCRGDASNFEIKLHNEFNVSKNPLFYNRAKATTTGFCVHGLKHSDETRKKISDARKGKTRSDETRKKISNSKKGKTHSDETRQKMSDTQHGKTVSDETRKKMSDAANGKTRSTETRKKMSDAKKNMSIETRKKMSDAQKNRSDETRKKMSDVRKGIPQKTGQCPYCLKVCSLGNLSRWHLDNCKLNPISLQQPMLAVDN